MLAKTILKILHTLAACGLIGGLGAYMLMLTVAPQATPADYADLRETIKAICDYLLLPSLALALVTGLLAMVVHSPFQEKGWVWIKAASGILMFKGVLTIVSAKAGHAAEMSRRIADGTAPTGALDTLIGLEWGTLWAVMAISVANVVLGVWRPRRIFPETKVVGDPDTATPLRVEAAPEREAA
ncbi:MAG: DUF2269 family protein [Parvularculaceae bacterium]